VVQRLFAAGIFLVFALSNAGASVPRPAVTHHRPHPADRHAPHLTEKRHPHAAGQHPKPQKPPKRAAALHGKPPKVKKH